MFKAVFANDNEFQVTFGANNDFSVDISQSLNGMQADFSNNSNFQTSFGPNQNTFDISMDQDPSGGGGIPPGGFEGDLLAKRTNGDYEVCWITPVNKVEQDNTKPITAAAVYTEIGNINALLASI